MFRCVVAHVPHNLPQLPRVNPHLSFRARGADRETRSGPLHSLAELFAELLSPRRQRQSLQARLLTTREPLHVVDDATDAFGIVTDDFGESAIVRGHVWGLGEELPGVTHGADRISNLVRDAGA